MKRDARSVPVPSHLNSSKSVQRVNVLLRGCNNHVCNMPHRLAPQRSRVVCSRPDHSRPQPRDSALSSCAVRGGPVSAAVLSPVKCSCGGSSLLILSLAPACIPEGRHSRWYGHTPLPSGHRGHPSVIVAPTTFRLQLTRPAPPLSRSDVCDRARSSEPANPGLPASKIAQTNMLERRSLLFKQPPPCQTVFLFVLKCASLSHSDVVASLAGKPGARAQAHV